MSFERYIIDLAFEEPIEPPLSGLLIAYEVLIRKIKLHAAKINEGKPNEENTTKATWHICHHEENGEPCVEQEI